MVVISIVLVGLYSHPFTFIGKREANIFSQQYLKGTPNELSLASSLSLIRGVSIEADAPPFKVSGEVFSSLGGVVENPREYIVQPGDTLSKIAANFSLKIQTILSANNLSRRSMIHPGQKLVILPIDGILHMVRKGETLSGIAERYSVKTQDIVLANNILNDGKIYIGDMLMIPGAKISKTPSLKSNYQRVPLARSYFICPLPAPCIITQGLHWYNAVDFSNGKCGEPVFAAAGGTVQRTGYTRLGGNFVRILHPNGVVTYYGHLEKIAAYPGEKVSQGQIVGYVGHTGHTIPSGPAGCHVHFDVRFAKNPFAQYKVGTALGR